MSNSSSPGLSLTHHVPTASPYTEGWRGRGEEMKGSFSAVTSAHSCCRPHHTEHAFAATADTLGASAALATVGGDTQPQVRKPFFNF